MKSIDGPHNIVRLLGLCTEERPYLMIMELLPRGDLKGVLHKARPTEDKASTLTLRNLVKMAADVAEGMAYLGTVHIVHRCVCVCVCVWRERERERGREREREADRQIVILTGTLLSPVTSPVATALWQTTTQSRSATLASRVTCTTATTTAWRAQRPSPSGKAPSPMCAFHLHHVAHAPPFLQMDVYRGPHGWRLFE
jgi:hypothetical protein